MSIETLHRRIRACLTNARINRADPDLRREDVMQALYYRTVARSEKA